MKKVGIITLTGNKNYGNKLQNYALQKVLEKNNCFVKTIWKKNNRMIYKLKRIIKLIIKKNYSLNDYKREKNFERFNNKFINCFYMKNNSVNSLDNYFDFYVIGSDQIWNPDVKNIYLGVSILDNKKDKISYSASLGVSVISDDYKTLIREKFTKENIKNISVREEVGKEIIENITNRDDIEVLIDPTMLVDISEWEKIMTKPKKVYKKYILNYFLGELSNDRKEEIDRIAKKNNCEIINVLDKNDPFYTSNPTDFLWLEKNAFLICTDSFHSSVFGILFNRPFVVFDREGIHNNMSSRLDNLIHTFNLKNRRYNGINISDENLKHDYTEAYKILKREREKSESFLREAFGIEKDN